MPLTISDNQKLAGELRGTKKNVYELARSLFGREFDDEDFDRLKADTGLFRCELCSEWLGKEQESTATDICVECANAGDEDEDG